MQLQYTRTRNIKYTDDAKKYSIRKQKKTIKVSQYERIQSVFDQCHHKYLIVV